MYFPSIPQPKWRNWQTRQVQGLVGIGLSGFESPLRHHVNRKRRNLKGLRLLFFSLSKDGSVGRGRNRGKAGVFAQDQYQRKPKLYCCAPAFLTFFKAIPVPKQSMTFGLQRTAIEVRSQVKIALFFIVINARSSFFPVSIYCKSVNIFVWPKGWLSTGISESCV